ncbi:MAG TPA: MFS transporter [Chloroflexota bacterium]|nr:MFS transporter [Chloroflexota bacterium]
MDGTAPAGLEHEAAVFARDALLITSARGIRQFAYGMLGVVLALSLNQDGVSPTAIGALITVSLIGDFCGTYVIGLGADQWGRRRTLAVLAVLMAATGAIFGLVRAFPVLLVAAFFGTLGTTASETAPFLPIEQAMLPLTARPEQRTRLFARYNLVASFAGACGALFAGLPEPLTHLGLSLDHGLRLMFGLYAGAALAVVLLVRKLSPSVEATARSGEPPTRRLVPHLGTSRGMVVRLSALFSVDALAGGLVVQSLLALYFNLRYGASLDALAALFFGANLLAALSFLAAAPLARRFGLLNTMVFSHLPSNVLLILIPIMPNYPLAALMLLLRQLLSQMDVPTRQAYTMALVPPEERTAAASVTSLARSAGSATTPVISGALMQGPLLAVGIPFLVGGGLKVAYDLALWRVFRRVRVDDLA